MPKKSPVETETERKELITFHPVALALFSVTLVLAGGLLGSGLVAVRSGDRTAKVRAPEAPAQSNPPAPAPQDVPPWGELMQSDIWLERPEEYVAFEVQTNRNPEWVFDKRSPDEVRSLMLSCGLTPNQVERALSSNRVSVTAEGTRVRPDDDLVFSLAPQVRAALYREQPGNSANRYIATPFIFQGQYVDEWLAGSELDAAAVVQFKRLVYPHGRAQCFSDLEVMMRVLPSDKQRLALVKAVSRQPALLVRMRVRPNTDVDKVLGYWGRGVRTKDARPLLESLKRLPDGGSLSLLYFLPPFARERLFTFPKPPTPGQPSMDCHWSTMNFFNDPPDNRFSDLACTLQYVQTNYYAVSKPTLYGDLVLVVKGGSSVVHSAVYLADDIVFTKNGNNVNQPWTLMRMKDLLAIYDQGDSPQLAFQRQNNR